MERNDQLPMPACKIHDAPRTRERSESGPCLQVLATRNTQADLFATGLWQMPSEVKVPTHICWTSTFSRTLPIWQLGFLVSHADAMGAQADARVRLCRRHCSIPKGHINSYGLSLAEPPQWRQPQLPFDAAASLLRSLQRFDLPDRTA